ncbi:T9SS type A sorting domain-containing protein [Polluticoccus soli]|uniref:DUF7948 domain-containing protein n=1 Tax=Polluticoccus soli TaxID=3034150 RepID=UPI0023E2B4D4|nr:T9SS type A sorting domain-containing protein [Flavipsychrobacter sp. JY13-12]
MITRYLPILLLLPFFAAGREPGLAETAKQQAKPLAFIENKGQIVDQYGNHRNGIDAKMEANGLVVFVGGGAIHYQWSRTSVSGTSPRPGAGVANWQASAPFKGGTALVSPSASAKGGTERHSPFDRGEESKEPVTTDIYRMDVELVGANTKAIAVYGKKQGYFENYYLPQCPDGATAYAYNTITYKNVYPGIDWVLYSKDNQLKYDFVVHAGGDAKQIKLRYNGATALRLADGALIAETPFGSITEQKPFSYVAETKQEVASSFAIEGNELRFAVAQTNNTLVIDPVLKWATYYGGSNQDLGYAVVSDTSGNVYLAGSTISSNNIATTGAFLATYTGTGDGLLVKFNTSGVRQWATYYGGSDGDDLQSLAYHPSGFIYGSGRTLSPTGLGTTGAFRTTQYNLRSDVFLVKFDLSGARQWGTYYGGEGYDDFAAVACDPAGNIFLAGETGSDTSISTPGCAQPLRANGNPAAAIDPDGFIVKFSSAGTRLWATYYGTMHTNHFHNVACDAFGNAYAVGEGIGHMQTTPGCFQPNSASPGSEDGVFVKYNGNGALIWATHYGGTSIDGISSVACYGTNVFIGGATLSTNMATSGAFQTSLQGGTDGFLAKFDSSGSRLWGSYIGGNNGDLVTAITMGPGGSIYAVGNTNSTSGIATSGAWQSSYGGLNDEFFAEVTSAGALRWSSYFGAAGYDGPNDYGRTSIAYDTKSDAIYFTGQTASTSGIATSTAHQTVYGGSTDALLAKFAPDTMVYIIPPFTNTLLCPDDTLKLAYKTVPAFNNGNSFTAQLSNASGSFATPANIGSKNSGLSDTIICVIPVNTPTGSNYRLRIVASSPAYISDDNGLNIQITNITDTAGSNTPVCAGSPLNLTASGTAGTSYSWSGPVSFTSTAQNPVISNPTTGHSGNYVVTISRGGCTRKDTTSVTVKPTPATPTAASNSPVCAGGALNLTATTNLAGASFKWTGPNSFNSTMQNPTIAPAAMSNAGVYDVQAELNGCVSGAGYTTVVVNTVSSLAIYPSPNDTICIGSNVTFVTVPLNAGTSPQYQWYKNGVLIPGATAITYTTPNITNGDSIYCVMTVTGVCSAPLSIASTKIGVTVLPLAPGPTVSITADPGLLLSPWQLVRFNTTVTDAGPLPKYQWKRNGLDVIGATGDNWSANNLSNGDTISCVVTSSVWCATPASTVSNKMVVNIKTGVEDVATTGGLKLYPNPNSGSFVVYLPLTKGQVSIDVVNAVGQTVYADPKAALTNHQLEITLPASVANGVYMLKLQHETGIETIRFTVAR